MHRGSRLCLLPTMAGARWCASRQSRRWSGGAPDRRAHRSGDAVARRRRVGPLGPGVPSRRPRSPRAHRRRRRLRSQPDGPADRSTDRGTRRALRGPRRARRCRDERVAPRMARGHPWVASVSPERFVRVRWATTVRGSSRYAPSRARGRARPRLFATASSPTSWPPIPRSAPSTSWSSIWSATTWASARCPEPCTWTHSTRWFPRPTATSSSRRYTRRFAPRRPSASCWRRRSRAAR